MKNLIIVMSVILKMTLSYGAISVSPVDYDVNLLSEKKKTFVLTNVGNTEATYTVELDKGHSLSKYVSYKKNSFRLSPGEKREIVLEVKENIEKISNQEYQTKLYILEKQQVENINYEINTIMNIYGYAGEIGEKFSLNSFEKKEEILIGEIENQSKKKIDLLIKILGSDKEILAIKKVRILKNRKFNLFELGMIKELSKGRKVVIESQNEVVEKEI